MPSQLTPPPPSQFSSYIASLLFLLLLVLLLLLLFIYLFIYLFLPIPCIWIPYSIFRIPSFRLFQPTIKTKSPFSSVIHCHTLTNVTHHTRNLVYHILCISNNVFQSTSRSPLCPLVVSWGYILIFYTCIIFVLLGCMDVQFRQGRELQGRCCLPWGR